MTKLKEDQRLAIALLVCVILLCITLYTAKKYNWDGVKQDLRAETKRVEAPKLVEYTSYEGCVYVKPFRGRIYHKPTCPNPIHGKKQENK